MSFDPPHGTVLTQLGASALCFSRQQLVELAAQEHGRFVIAAQLDTATVHASDDGAVDAERAPTHLGADAEAIEKRQCPGREAATAGLGARQRLTLEHDALASARG